MESEKMICDLHVHSTASDGSLSPEGLIDEARREGVRAVALTDHNTLTGLARFEAAAAAGGEIVAIPGVEVTAGWGDHEVHILGLFIPVAARKPLAAYIAEIDRRKHASNRKLIERLALAGYEIDYESVLAAAGEATPNRVHVANILMERGYVSSVQIAFQTLLRDGGEFYRSAPKFDALDVIGILRSLRVVPILAHPLLTLSRDEIDILLPQAKDAGLVGVETVYPLYSEDDAAFMADAAARFGLLPSGGSDFHGVHKPDTRMGRGRDNIEVPFSVYEDLMHMAQLIQNTETENQP